MMPFFVYTKTVISISTVKKKKPKFNQLFGKIKPQQFPVTYCGQWYISEYRRHRLGAKTFRTCGALRFAAVAALCIIYNIYFFISYRRLCTHRCRHDEVWQVGRCILIGHCVYTFYNILYLLAESLTPPPSPPPTTTTLGKTPWAAPAITYIGIYH